MLVGMLYSLYGKQYFHNVTPLLTKAALKGFFFFFSFFVVTSQDGKNDPADSCKKHKLQLHICLLYFCIHLHTLLVNESVRSGNVNTEYLLKSTGSAIILLKDVSNPKLAIVLSPPQGCM